MPKPAKSIEEIFPLIEYCRAGKLTEVTQWIKDGNPLDPPPAKRRSSRRMPLQIAIEKNFYSLAELLLEGGADPSANGNALDYCVWKGRPEIARLLLDHGVLPDSVDFMFVCEMGDPDMIRLLLDRGVDPTENFAFYHAIIGKTKPAFGIYKKWKAAFPALEEQLNAALLHFIEKKRIQGVALCLWAGADPSKPAIDVASSGKEEWRETPLVAGAWKGNLQILKTLHPEKYPDLLGEALSSCHREKSVIDYLIGVGAPLNGKPNGGSALLDRAVDDLGWDLGWSSMKRDVGEKMEMLRHVVGRGAKWIPDRSGDFRNIRSNFKNLTGPQIVEFVKIMREGEAAEVPVIEELLKTPKMKGVMGKHSSEVEKILHPSPPKPAAPMEEESPKRKEPVRKVIKIPIAEVRERTEAFLLDFICQRPLIPFWTSHVSDRPLAAKTKKIMGLDRSEEDSRAVEILKEVAANLEKRLECAKIQIKGNSYRGLAEVIYEIREGYDWVDVIERAWSLHGRKPNEHLLTDVGAQSLLWMEEQKKTGKFIKEAALSRRMGLNGRCSDLEQFLEEIGQKTPKAVRWEKKGDRKSDPPVCYKLWLEDAEMSAKSAGAWNPVFDFNLRKFKKSELDECRDRILDHLLDVQPEGDRSVPIVFLDSRKGAKACFPGAEFGSFYYGPDLPGFFQRINLMEGLQLACDFSKNARAWFVEVIPSEKWATLRVNREMIV